MRILALETSSMTGSVAALDDERLLGETLFDPKLRSAQSFAPAIDQQLAAVTWRATDVELIAVTVGPGSFTGLRVGVTAAKMLAYVAGAQVIGVNTLKAIAAQVPPEVGQVTAVLDAQRQQLFTATFARRGDDWEATTEPQIVDNEPWLAVLANGMVVTGAGLSRLRPRLPAGVVVVDERHWTPRAATVGRIGYVEFQRGKRDDYWKLTPRYYRKSAAEEKLEGLG